VALDACVELHESFPKYLSISLNGVEKRSKISEEVQQHLSQTTEQKPVVILKEVSFS